MSSSPLPSVHMPPKLAPPVALGVQPGKVPSRQPALLPWSAKSRISQATKGPSWALSRRGPHFSAVSSRLGLSLLLLLGAALVPTPPAQAEDQFFVPWGVCSAPPKVLKERVGATTEPVFALCLRASGLFVNFQNAEKFFIGDGAKKQGFGTQCVNITGVFTVAEFNGTSQFIPGGSLPPGLLSQAWEFTLWPPYDPALKQTVNITVSNYGPSDLQLTGIDYKSLGLPKNFVFAQGTTKSIAVPYSKIKLDFAALPVVKQFILGNNLDKGVTALAFLKYPTSPTSQAQVFITYALVEYDPGSPYGDYTFFFYESTYTPATSTGGPGRRLLVVAPKNKAPPAACSKGCCKPAAPLPRTCNAKSKTWPACAKSCNCFCRK